MITNYKINDDRFTLNKIYKMLNMEYKESFICLMFAKLFSDIYYVYTIFEGKSMFNPYLCVRLHAQNE